MRNNIKRFSVAVLAACGLAVSAALAESSSQAELGVIQKDFYVATDGGNVSPYDTPENAAQDINTGGGAGCARSRRRSRCPARSSMSRPAGIVRRTA